MNTPNIKPSNTREALLDAAQGFVQESSYDGFSFRDIAEVVGIRKASIYHHFETKEALAVEMLQRAAKRLQSWCDSQSARPAKDRLAAYCFEFYGDALKAGECLCPGGAFAAGWGHMPDGIRAATLDLLQVHHDYLAQALRDGQADGSLNLPLQQSPEATADWFAANIQGALALARMQGGRARFDALCQISLDQLLA